MSRCLGEQPMLREVTASARQREFANRPRKRQRFLDYEVFNCEVACSSDRQFTTLIFKGVWNESNV